MVHFKYGILALLWNDNRLDNRIRTLDLDDKKVIIAFTLDRIPDPSIIPPDMVTHNQLRMFLIRPAGLTTSSVL